MPTSSTRSAVVAVSDEQVSQYHRDGYLVVPHLFDPQVMLDWKQKVKDLLGEEAASATGGVKVWMCDALPDYFRAAMTDPQTVQILQRLIGRSVEFLSVKAVFKNDTRRFGTPWHQDRFYWHGAEKISIWIALDDATPENGCLKVVPRTHHTLFPVQHAKTDHGFELQIDDPALDAMPADTLAVARGGAVFFSDLLVHSSHPNTTGADRWAFISTYRNGAVKDDATVWKTSMVVGSSL